MRLIGAPLGHHSIGMARVKARVMSSRRVRIAPGWRVVIPAEFRKALGVRVGDDMLIELRDDGLRLRSRQAAIRKVQAMVRQYIPDRGRSLADELIAERREDAAREERE